MVKSQIRHAMDNYTEKKHFTGSSVYFLVSVRLCKKNVDDNMEPSTILLNSTNNF